MKTYDLYAIGNALVDSEYEVTDPQPKAMIVDKRHMTLIDAARPSRRVVLEGNQQTTVPASKVKAFDTNGAGDMFAGAFFYAVTHGHGHAQAIWLANQAAGQVVSQCCNRLTHQVMDRIKARFEMHSSGQQSRHGGALRSACHRRFRTTRAYTQHR